MDIQYNSWLKKFKNPFGAIADKGEVEFNIKVDSNEYVKSVALVMKKLGDSVEISEYTMRQIEANKYNYHYQVTKGSGLYLYCFKITAINNEGNEFILYYGNSPYGGQGYQYVNEASIKWYQLTCYETNDAAPEWYTEGVFYQIFPDRFFNGNENKVINNPKKNTFIYGTEEDLPMYVKDDKGDIERWDFYGGNLKGIKQKIPYFKELGITALYLNPIFEANSNHRYDTNDYFNVDPVLGTNEEFKELVDVLHEHNIRIILDGVFSHVGRNSQYFNYSGVYGKNVGAYQNMHSKYYNWFKFLNYPNEYESWWGIADLPEINKHNRSYQEFIYGEESSVIDFWEKYNIDGWRLDVADELPNFFLEGIRKKVNNNKDQVLIGEVWEDASNKVAYGERKEYASHPILHSVMNYPLREQILDLVNEKRPMLDVISSMMGMKENYPDYFYYNLFNNIGTHDTARVLNECEGSFLKVAQSFALLFMMPGVPCVYYGDEVGLDGKKDPDNRRFYPWKNPNKEMKKVCQNWAMVRRSHESLLKGGLHILYNLDKSLFAIHRYHDNEECICFFNFTNIESEIISEHWKCDELDPVQATEIIKRFDIPRMTVSRHHYLFLVKQIIN